MKKIFLFISLWGIAGSGLFTHSIGLASAMTVNSEIFAQDEETIELHGYFAIGRMRALVSPFNVTLNESVLTIHYLLSAGNVQLDISDASGQLFYSDGIDVIANDQLLIDMSNWEEGTYNLSFTHSSGGIIYGSFEIFN
ncbi:hypothetical protein FACS1894182_02340 [Bacteroidia bacterium]|nr:hypothetical protein FACS1894182_02340 [Bacteroidia bacterium]